jgi:Mg-chelatase subunit ChlD
MRLAISLLVLACAIAGAAPKHRDPAAFVFVIDRSGSMKGAKLDAAKQAALAAVDALGPEDRVAIVVFDSEASVLVRLSRAADRKRIAQQLARLETGGGTNLLPALREAFETLKPVKAARRHVIVLTDGEFPTDGIAELAQDMRAERITISTVGVAGADRNALAMIADAGDGRLYMVDITALPKLFAKEVAESLKP